MRDEELREALEERMCVLADEWETHALTETVWGEDNPEITGGEWEKGYWAALRYAAGRVRLLTDGAAQ